MTAPREADTASCPEELAIGTPFPNASWPSSETLAMVLRYTHLTDDHVDQAVAKLNAGFSDAIAPELHTPPEEASRGAA